MGFDQIRQKFAQLLVDHGFIDSIYDLVISIVEKKDSEYEVYAAKYDEYEDTNLKEIEAPKDSDLAQYVGSEYMFGGNYYREWNVGRGTTEEDAMQNLYCKLREILELYDEIEDCYG